jgi:aspartyl protease family protein
MNSNCVLLKATIRRAGAVLALLVLSPPSFAEEVPYVNGFIGTKPVRFMVDTGASEVSIPYRRAIELGIPVFAGRRSESKTASGSVGIYRIKLPAVTVGSVTVQNVAAHVALNESGSQDILLGMSFLKYVSVSMRGGMVAIGP